MAKKMNRGVAAAQTVAAPVVVPQVQNETDEGRRNNISHEDFVMAWEDIELVEGFTFEQACDNPQAGFRKMNRIYSIEDFCEYLQYKDKSAQSRSSQIRTADKNSSRYFPLRSLPGEGGRRTEETLNKFRDGLMAITGATAPTPATMPAVQLATSNAAAQTKRGPGRPSRTR